jgi:hypothetical protein
MMARWLPLVQIKKEGHLKNLEYVKFYCAVDDLFTNAGFLGRR